VNDVPAPAADSVSELRQQIGKLETERDGIRSERDEYKRHYVLLLEAYRKLEAGLYGQKRERFVGGGEQLTLSLLAMLVGDEARESTPEPTAAAEQQVEAHTRRRPTGRKPLPEGLPRIDIEVVPPDVQRQGLDAFERIGEDTSETVERRPSSFVVVRTVRPKYVPKERPRGESGPQVLQAPAPELPIPRSIAGPGLLAETIVRRWQDHLPLYRLESIYEREGLPLARSTICGWHQEVAQLLVPLIIAMWKDAMTSPYLCTDATGVLVQALQKCRRAHFFVVVAPEKHVLFGYSPKHDGKAVDKLLGEYKGFLVADAHSVYNHLYEKGDVVEVGCWAHARRYVFKALETDGPRARHALSLIQSLFLLERAYANATPAEKLRRRQQDARPIVDAFFSWCDEEALKVLDETPISKAIRYARNQRTALQRFLDACRGRRVGWGPRSSRPRRQIPLAAPAEPQAPLGWRRRLPLAATRSAGPDRAGHGAGGVLGQARGNPASSSAGASPPARRLFGWLPGPQEGRTGASSPAKLSLLSHQGSHTAASGRASAPGMGSRRSPL